MDYPTDFPEHLHRPVDAAIHEAEGEFLDAKKASKYFSSSPDGLLFKYALKIFTVFAYQMAIAWEQGLWSGERTRRGIDACLHSIAQYAYYKKHPRPGSVQSFDQFWKEAEAWIKNSDEWRKIQDRLKEVARAQVAAKKPESGGEGDIGDLPSVNPEDRRALIDGFILKMSQVGRKISRKDIWQAAGYKDDTEFQRFQRGDTRTTVSAATNFGRVLRMNPEEFLRQRQGRK